MTCWYLKKEGEKPKLSNRQASDVEEATLLAIADYGEGWEALFSLDRSPEDDETIDEELGEIVPNLPFVRARKWAEVKAYRDQVRYGGCDTPSGRIDTDLESQHKINGAVTMAIIAGAQFALHWTMEDNSVCPMDATSMISAGTAVGVFDAQCHAVGQWIRGTIEAALDLEAILAIDPAAAPWPS